MFALDSDFVFIASIFVLTLGFCHFPTHKSQFPVVPGANVWQLEAEVVKRGERERKLDVLVKFVKRLCLECRNPKESANYLKSDHTVSFAF